MHITKIHKNHDDPYNLRLLDTEIYILFPYRFDFGRSLDKLLVVNKMLKQLYRKPRIGLNDPLYADVWVKLKVFGIRLMCGVFDWHLPGATIIQYLVKYTSKASHQNLTQLNVNENWRLNFSESWNFQQFSSTFNFCKFQQFWSTLLVINNLFHTL